MLTKFTSGSCYYCAMARCSGWFFQLATNLDISKKKDYF